MKGIGALIELFIFNNNLNKQLNHNSSEIFEGKFYIINEKWFSEYKKFFLYDNIYQILSPKIDNISIFNNETTIRKIYNNNKNIFINNH